MLESENTAVWVEQKPEDKGKTTPRETNGDKIRRRRKA